MHPFNCVVVQFRTGETPVAPVSRVVAAGIAIEFDFGRLILFSTILCCLLWIVPFVVAGTLLVVIALCFWLSFAHFIGQCVVP